MRQKTIWIILMALVLSLLFVGCSGGNQREDDKTTDVAAYQYTKGEVQRQLPQPSSAVFPHITTGSVQITENDDDTIEIKGTVNHKVSGETVTSAYTIVLLYEGNGLWRTESLDIQ